MTKVANSDSPRSTNPPHSEGSASERGASATATDEAAVTGSTVDSLATQVSERLKEAGIDPQGVMTAAREHAGDVHDKVLEEVKTNPLRTLGLAAAAGLVVGYLASR